MFRRFRKTNTVSIESKNIMMKKRDRTPVLIKKLPSHVIPLSELKIPKEYSMEEIGITQTRITNFFQCRMKWFFGINRLKPRYTKFTYDFGNVIHHIFEKAVIDPKFMDDLLHCQTMDVLKQSINEYALKEEHQFTDIDIIKAYVTLKKFFKYVNIFEKRKFEYAEKEFCVPYKIGGRTILLRGKLDACINVGKNEFNLVEYKTKQKFIDSFFERLIYDFQSQFYSVLDPRITGVSYLIIRKTTMTSVDPKKLIKKLENDIELDPSKYYKEYTIEYDANDRLCFDKELQGKLRTIQSVLFTRNQLNIFKEQSACSGFGDCPYIEICRTNTIDMQKYHIQKKYFSELGDI